MSRPSLGIHLLTWGILMMGGCLASDPLPPCDPTPASTGHVDVTRTGVGWLDVAVPISFSMTDDDVRLEATWRFPEGDLSRIQKLEYYGFERFGYMGGDWVMIGPRSVSSGVVSITLPDVSDLQDMARREGRTDPVFHLFVMFSGGEPTLTLQGAWNGTELAYSYGSDLVHGLDARDFQRTEGDPTFVSARLDISNPQRMVALVFDAEETAGLLWRSPTYERPDGSVHPMRIPLLVEFSDLSGTWGFTMRPGELDPERVVVWGMRFDPARPQLPEDPSCG